MLMQLYRTILPTPIGEMLALSSDTALCALEFTTVKGRARGLERMSRLNARLAKWFPPHEIVDHETPVIAPTRRCLEDYFAGASAAIGAGEHVHVHNVEGTRGRGDLAEVTPA